MKRTITLIILIVSTVSIVYSQVEKEIITSKGIANLEKNMSLEKAIEILKPNYKLEKKVTSIWESQTDTMVIIKVFEIISNNLLFSFNVDYSGNPTGIISAFQIYSDRYKTVENLSIGDTYKKIKETYELDRTYFNYNDGLFIFLKNKNLRFRLYTKDDSNNNFPCESLTLENVPESFPVDMIVLY